jgi:putative acetyltransferase
MDELSLCPREQSHLTALAELWVASWRAALPAIDFTARLPWFLDHLQTLENAGAQTICAFDANEILLGFVTIDPATGYLDQLAVKVEAQGTGVARKLLDAAKLLSPETLVLDVNQDNPRALRFYEREGFRQVGEGVNEKSGLKIWRMAWPKA